jgi:hypothetical protein
LLLCCESDLVVGEFQNASPQKPLQAAEKMESVSSAAKAAEGSKVLIAALQRCATQSQTFSAAW